MFSPDLQDAYFQIPVQWESRSYLCFASRVVSNSSRRCTSACPRLRRSSPESLLWFLSGVSLLRYVDDWLVVVESRDLLLRHQALLLQLYSDLRIVMN